MSDKTEKEPSAPQKPSVWDDLMVPLIDGENILESPPTLKIAGEAIRNLLACSTILGGSVFLFIGGFGFSFINWVLIPIGAWAAVYTFLSICQVWVVMLSGLFHLIRYFFGKRLFTKHASIITTLVILPALLVWVGLMFMAVELVRDFVGPK